MTNERLTELINEGRIAPDDVVGWEDIPEDVDPLACVVGKTTSDLVGARLARREISARQVESLRLAEKLIAADLDVIPDEVRSAIAKMTALDPTEAARLLVDSIDARAAAEAVAGVVGMFAAGLAHRAAVVVTRMMVNGVDRDTIGDGVVAVSLDLDDDLPADIDDSVRELIGSVAAAFVAAEVTRLSKAVTRTRSRIDGGGGVDADDVDAMTRLAEAINEVVADLDDEDDDR
ncbi:MAG: hypothetical protein D6683_03980 [Actinomyces sp.]|nr:MAG: hypothetical protein D6683_03980 [Actinomyces sp.]